MTELQALVRDGLAVDIGDNPSGFDQLFRMADQNDPASMSIASSAALTTVINVLSAGYPVTVDGWDRRCRVPARRPRHRPVAPRCGSSPTRGRGGGSGTSSSSPRRRSSSRSGPTRPATRRRGRAELDPIRSRYAADLGSRWSTSRSSPGMTRLRRRYSCSAAVEVRTVAAGAVATTSTAPTTISAAAEQANVLIADYNARIRRPPACSPDGVSSSAIACPKRYGARPWLRVPPLDGPLKRQQFDAPPQMGIDPNKRYTATLDTCSARSSSPSTPAFPRR